MFMVKVTNVSLVCKRKTHFPSRLFSSESHVSVSGDMIGPGDSAGDSPLADASR